MYVGQADLSCQLIVHSYAMNLTKTAHTGGHHKSKLEAISRAPCFPSAASRGSVLKNWSPRQKLRGARCINHLTPKEGPVPSRCRGDDAGVARRGLSLRDRPAPLLSALQVSRFFSKPAPNRMLQRILLVDAPGGPWLAGTGARWMRSTDWGCSVSCFIRRHGNAAAHRQERRRPCACTFCWGRLRRRRC